MLKKFFSFRFKYRFHLLLQKFKTDNYFTNEMINSSKNQVYIFLAADYGNLGDVAITYAQTKFLNDNSEYQVIEIPISKSLEGLWFVKKNIKKTDLVTTVGGGNLGDLYDQIEFIRQLVVSFFPYNKIVSFPQTFDFANTVAGSKALDKAKRVYNSHSNLYFVAREKTSYALMQEHFKNATILLTPDIVISLDMQYPIKERKGVVVTMRKDKEKNLSEAQKNFIDKEISNRFESVSFYDTHINKNNLSVEVREQELNKIWNTYRSAELVVTDRLHGMIFCYITNTPCLVFQNNNHKVRETFEWIKGNTNINLVTEYSEEQIKNFLSKENFNTGEMINVIAHYESLVKLFK